MHLLTLLFSVMLYFTCFAYLYDIIIFARYFKNYIHRLNNVFQRLRLANLTFKQSNCALGIQSISFVGHIISDKTLALTQTNLRALQNGLAVQIKLKLKGFVKYATYYRKFINKLFLNCQFAKQAFSKVKSVSIGKHL